MHEQQVSVVYIIQKYNYYYYSNFVCKKKSYGEHFFITKALIVCTLYGIPIMKSNIILRNNKESKSLQ